MNCRFGRSLLRRPTARPTATRSLRSGELPVPLRIDVHDVRDVRHAAVRDVAAGGKDDGVRRHVLRYRGGGGVLAEALGPALKEVEIPAVVRELDVDRRAELRLEQLEEAVHLRHEDAVRHEALEGERQRVSLGVDAHGERPAKVLPVVHRDELLEHGNLSAVAAQQLARVHRLEGVRLEVDDVELSRRVVHDLLDRHVDPQPRLARREEDGIVVARAVHRPRAEAGNHADEPVLALDAGRPPELVSGEGDPGERRKEVVPDARADDLLDHDPHLLADVEEPTLRPVFDRVGPEDGGVDLRDRVHEGLEPLLLRALIREEEAAVLARERVAEAVLEEARAADDERPVLELVEHDRERLNDLGREARVLESLYHVRVFEADLVDVLVFLLAHLVHVVVAEEAEQDVGGDVPAPGRLDRPQQVVRLGGFLDDLPREKETRAFSAELAAALRRVDRAVEKLEEILHVDVALRDSYVVELAREEPADERDDDARLRSVRQPHAVEPDVAVLPERVDHLGEGEVAARHAGEKLELVVEEPFPYVGEEPIVGVMLRCDAEDLAAPLVGDLDGGAPAGPVHEPGGLVIDGRLGRAGAVAQPLRFLDAAPAEEIEHSLAHGDEEVAVGLPQDVENDLPVAPALVRPQRGKVLDGLLDLPVKYEDPETIGDGPQEPRFVREEGPVVGGRHLLRVVDADLARLFPLHEDVRPLGPRRFLEAPGRVRFGADVDPRAADLGVLPSRRHRVDDRPDRRVHVDAGPLEDLLDPVEALELFLALAREPDDIVQLSLLIRHAVSLPGRICRPPSRRAARRARRGSRRRRPAAAPAAAATPSRCRVRRDGGSKSRGS